MSDDFAVCRKSCENVMRFKAPKVTSTAVYDDSVSFSYTFDTSSFFQRFRTISLVTPLAISLPLIGQDEFSTSYYVGYYKGVNGSSIVFTPDATNYINDNSIGSTFTVNNAANVFLLFFFSYRNIWYIGAADQAVDVFAGAGIRVTGSYPDFTIINDNPDLPVSLSAGTGITISGTYPNFTVTNSLPDRTVAIASGTGISATGTYPNFTVTNTAPDQTVAIASGTGISATGTYPNFTITNSAPDQTVTLTAGSNITITGSYPNFTIASTGGSGMSSHYLKATSVSIASLVASASTLLPYTGNYTFTSSSGGGDWTNTGGGIITYVGSPALFYFVFGFSCTSPTNKNQICLYLNGTPMTVILPSPNTNSALTTTQNYTLPVAVTTNDQLSFAFYTSGTTTYSNVQFYVNMVSD